MPESFHEQIAEEIVRVLNAIVGDDGTNYWYTPDLVYRFNTIQSKRVLDTGYTTIYVVAPAPEGEESREETTQAFTKEVHFDLLLAQQFDLAESPAHEAEPPLRWTVQNRMMRDAEKAITADTSFNTLTVNIEIPIRHRDGEETFVPGWAAVFARIVAKYDHPQHTP